jgi:glycosyltransferase involved in cell wall biosynthesis
VLPSISEGLSNALLEAMAAARPIVATDIGANAEAVVAGESALLVPPGDASALAGAILQLYRDRALAARLGRAARARVSHRFSLARSAALYIDLYRALIRGEAGIPAAEVAPEQREVGRP